MAVEPPAFSECVATLATPPVALGESLCVVVAGRVAGSAAGSENQSESTSSVLGALAAALGGAPVLAALLWVAVCLGAAGSVESGR